MFVFSKEQFNTLMLKADVAPPGSPTIQQLDQFAKLTKQNKIELKTKTKFRLYESVQTPGTS